MIERVVIGILTLKRIGSKDSVRAILQMLEPSYAPHKYNTYEPIRTVYDKENIDEALEMWGDSMFLWKRTKPKVDGIAGMGYSRAHDGIDLDLSPKAFKYSEVLDLLREMEGSFGINIAYIHASTPAEIEDLDHYATHVSDFSQGLTTHQLREGLPGLCWTTLFGEPYKQLFGDRLSNVPAYSVTDVGGATCIQLTEDIRDVDKKPEEYEAAKKAAIDHLDSDAFRVMGVRRKYRVPEFNL
jgi:hypothetical protein